LLSKAIVLHKIGMTRDAVDVLDTTLEYYPDLARAKALKISYETTLKVRARVYWRLQFKYIEMVLEILWRHCSSLS
jgi:hypothetical protein